MAIIWVFFIYLLGDWELHYQVSELSPVLKGGRGGAGELIYKALYCMCIPSSKKNSQSPTISYFTKSLPVQTHLQFGWFNPRPFPDPYELTLIQILKHPILTKLFDPIYIQRP